MKKYIYEAKNGKRLEVNDENLKSLLERDGFELVEEIDDTKSEVAPEPDDKKTKGGKKKAAAGADDGAEGGSVKSE